MQNNSYELLNKIRFNTFLQTITSIIINKSLLSADISYLYCAKKELIMYGKHSNKDKLKTQKQ